LDFRFNCAHLSRILSVSYVEQAARERAEFCCVDQFRRGWPFDSARCIVFGASQFTSNSMVRGCWSADHPDRHRPVLVG
jgi:hypothetical protein